MSSIFTANAPTTPAGAGGFAPPLVIESDTSRFVADVLEASRNGPVIVDFWAPWCGPCKTLGPALEKLVKQRNGRVRLVKINVDENQSLAAQFRVQSIPTVYAFLNGKPLDGFMGALPESQLKAFIDRLDGGPGLDVDAVMAEGRALLDAGNPEEAMNAFQDILSVDQAHPGALAGVLRCQLAFGEIEAVREVLDALEPPLATHADITAVRTALDLAERAQHAPDPRPLLARLEADPADHDSRLALAEALFARGDAQGACDQLLESLRRDRTWNEGAARVQLLKFWEALGPTHPVTVSGRRKLSSILFS
ncbi:thioredoxin [Pararhodospirillum photometricum]|uniref:Thioredoxin n=1 Tax=Pararhodospirillum photometricum DSM 122 TaxID=1150469 RepID=H6SQT7_PARPM|nr:thioredoxin [Pararhodospirillum photometricum]CCG07402.1 Thioredoxin-related [Pararhodospirillum photometricum DSM 122]